MAVRLFRIVVVVVVAVVAVDPSAVQASLFGSNQPYACDTQITSQCVANNGTHIWMPVQLQANMQTEASWSFNNNYAPLDSVSTVQTSNIDVADVVLFDAAFGFNGYRGWANCEPFADYGGSGPHGFWCKSQFISFNSGSYPGEYDNYVERRHVACHEIGHTLGLQHSSETGSCMRSLPLGYTGTYPSALTSHDISHLEGWY